MSSRRDFLKAAGIATASGILGCQKNTDNKVKQAKDTKKKKAEVTIAKPGQLKVPKRIFGKSGIRVSCLSLGGMFDIPNNQIMLKRALDWGVTYWDTADCYGGGRSELGIGKFFKNNPKIRPEIFLVTKSDSRTPKGMTNLLNRSLKRMNTNYIDLYFIHGLSNIRELTPEMKEWVKKAKAEGKIKLFGFSTHKNMQTVLKGAAKLGWIDGIMMAYNYRLMHKQDMKEAVKACVDAGIGLTAMKTQGGGQVQRSNETEMKLAGRYVQKGFTDKQAKLMAIWQNSNIASICSQMPNLSILSANVSACVQLPKFSMLDQQLLDQYARETCSGYCAGCSDLCESAIAGNVPVSDIMRYLMYHNSYDNKQEEAKNLFSKIPSKIRSSLELFDYSRAEKICPNKMPIKELMKQASKILV